MPIFSHLTGKNWVVAAGIFVSAVTGWTRFSLSLANWNLYQQLGIKPGVWYLCVNGLVIGLVYTVAGILVLYQPGNWKKTVAGLLISGLVVHWIDRICFASSQDARIGLPFSLVFSAGLTLIALILMYSKTTKAV